MKDIKTLKTAEVHVGDEGEIVKVFGSDCHKHHDGSAFLLRVNSPFFGIPLGLAGQAAVWKSVHEVPEVISTVLWFMAFALWVTVLGAFILKAARFPTAVLRELLHPFRLNFFYAPFVDCCRRTLAS